MFVYDEFGSQYNPEGLAARERQHQSAQDHRSRRPRKIATAGRSWGVTNGNDRATRAGEKGESYELTPEQCAELQQEGIQYYHRYLSLFQINDFEGVVRDTQ